MRRELTRIGYDLRQSKSPVIPIYIEDSDLLLKFNKELFEQGVFSVSIVYPAVKPTEGRIRLVLNASHSYDHIDRTLHALEKVGRKYGLIQQVSELVA